QQLQYRRGANDLHALGVLRPANGITNCRGLVRTRCLYKRIGDLMEQRRRNATHLLHHLRSVAREMTFQFLENASWILQLQIVLGIAEAVAFIATALRVVSLLVLLPS